MRARKLEIACPACGSAEVFYSCTPNCCFNHVCAECGATFEPATKATGGYLPGVEPPDPMPDATDPTAPCAKCDAPMVWMTENGQLVCSACSALLILEITELHPGN